MQLNRWKVNGAGRCSGMALAALLGWTTCAVAGPMCEYLTAKYGWQCDREYYTWTCTETTDWDFPLDLDGDGVSDFVLSRRTAYSRCEARPPSVYVRGATAITWALFPEAHVEVLGLVDWPQTPVLAAGYPIVPDPTQLSSVWRRSAWAFPAFEPHIHGYGIGATTENYICPGLPCPLPRDVGLLNLSIWDALFGVRIARADGWHLGWIHVSEYAIPKPLPEGRTTRADMDDYAIHPDPDTEVEAGQPPRPRLWYAVEGDRVRLWWSAAWAGYQLERAPALTDATWEAVDGVVDRSVTLPARDGPRFFRLVQPPGP